MDPSKRPILRVELKATRFRRHPQRRRLRFFPNVQRGTMLLVVFQLHDHGDVQAIGKALLRHAEHHVIACPGSGFDARVNDLQMRQTAPVNPLVKEPREIRS